MRKGGPAAQSDILHREQELPERRDLRRLAPPWNTEVNPEHHEVSRQNPQRPPAIKAAKPDSSGASQPREQLPADEVTAEYKKEVNPDPPKPMHVPRQGKAKDPAVVNDHKDDRDRPQQIEPRLPFAMNEPRIKGRVAHRRRERSSCHKPMLLDLTEAAWA